jgi:hypothetical protein
MVATNTIVLPLSFRENLLKLVRSGHHRANPYPVYRPRFVCHESESLSRPRIGLGAPSPDPNPANGGAKGGAAVEVIRRIFMSPATAGLKDLRPKNHPFRAPGAPGERQTHIRTVAYAAL